MVIARKYVLLGGLVILVMGVLIGRHVVPLVIREGVGITIHGVPDAGCRDYMHHSRHTPWEISTSEEIYAAGCGERYELDDYAMVYCDCRPQDNTMDEGAHFVEPSDGGH